MLNQVISIPSRQPTESAARAARHGVNTGLVEVDRVSIVFGKGRHAHKAVEETSIRVEPGALSPRRSSV